MPNIQFDAAAQIMELSLQGLKLHTNLEVGHIYDLIEDSIAETGRTHWYFLVEMGDVRINPAVWSYWASRGRMLNLGHSLGTVRYGAAPETRSRLNAAAKSEGFDPNLCDSRQEALDRIAQLKQFAVERPEPQRSLTFHELFDRFTFDHHLKIVDFDLTSLSLRHDVDIQDLYDHIETRILCMSPQLQWFFLVNYENVQIAPTVASQFALRGRIVNQRYSMGTARYGMPLPIQDQIHMRAESRDFAPNVFDTREEALAYLLSIKTAAQ